MAHEGEASGDVGFFFVWLLPSGLLARLFGNLGRDPLRGRTETATPPCVSPVSRLSPRKPAGPSQLYKISPTPHAVRPWVPSGHSSPSAPVQLQPRQWRALVSSFRFSLA